MYVYIANSLNIYWGLTIFWTKIVQKNKEMYHVEYEFSASLKDFEIT
jgi:hypothetical protein